MFMSSKSDYTRTAVLDNGYGFPICLGMWVPELLLVRLCARARAYVSVPEWNLCIDVAALTTYI